MNIALILSGGTGTRLGGEIPKQYLKVGKREILFYSLQTLADCEQIDGIQIVAHSDWRTWIDERLIEYGLKAKLKGYSNPGETRQMSIFNGLCDIKQYADQNDGVLIHDAARPNLSLEMVNACIEALKEHDGVLPVLPMKDTVYLSSNGTTISSLLDRKQVVAGQAPEMFVLGKYWQANSVLLPDKIYAINGSTEPAIMAGMDIAMIEGDETNYKITTKADLERFADSVGD